MKEQTTNIFETAPVQEIVLLTGATGYIGGRLLKVMEQAGMRVRCVARNPETLKPRVTPMTEVVRGDVLDFDSMRLAAEMKLPGRAWLEFEVTGTAS